MKLGGLFSGIGGFELAWTQLGHEVAWMCEIDKNARKVLAERFPGVPIYEDVEQLDPAQVEAVDVLTGGSPCQGFSIAGSRSGLEHGESRLFADYIRIMDGLAERGLKWALWENVPGVLSIKNPDGERTFTHVIGALVGSDDAVGLDPKRKWNVGLASEGERAVAWRVLDSRHFGVAQRRRRVFACVAFGDSAARFAGRALLAKSEGVSGDSSSGESEGEGFAEGFAGSFGGAGGATVIRKVRSSEWVEDTTGSTLAARDYKDTGDVVVQSSWWDGGQTAESLTATSDNQRMPDKQRFQAVMAPSGVRRLTPIECERLQAFPDGWTEPAGSDSARYKALGNAVTVNTVRWVLGRMLEQA